MRDRLPADAVPVAAAAVVVLFACGSSSVPTLLDVGRPGRWIALVLLLVLSAWWAAGRGRTLLVHRHVTWSAAAVVLLAVVSSAWSVAPRITFERAVTLAVLALVALLIAQAVAGRPASAERVLVGLVAGSVIVALAGLLVLAVAHRDAVEIATTDLPPRFKGMGQDPNTSSLLFGVAAPIATWLALTSRTTRRRLAFGAALALLVGSIVGSGSHGALLAGGLGSAAVVLLCADGYRRRIVAMLAVVAIAGAGFWIDTLPEPSRTNPVVVPAVPVPAPKPGYLDAQINTPLDGELGIPLPGQSLRRTLTTSSGRTQAWRGAIRQTEQRPFVGYGFGTESRVFIDRWSGFSGSVPENSYVGIALQLGIAGLLVFAALLAALGLAALASLRRERRGVATAGVGVLTAGLAAAVGQSYVYSVGNIATVTLWITVFLVATTEPAHD